MDVISFIKCELPVILHSGRVKPSVSLRQPLEIQSNRLYDVYFGRTHLIAKEYLQPDEWDMAPLREFKSLELLRPLEMAPRPIFYDPAVGPLVIYAYLPGKMWDRRTVSASDLVKLADLWLSMSRLPVDWLSRDTEWTMNDIFKGFRYRLEAYARWTETAFKPGMKVAELCLDLLEKRQGVFRELAEMPPVLCFCRCDPRFANIIQQPKGRLGLVDWEDSGLRDPAREAVDIMMHPNQEDLVSWTAWSHFLEPYLASRRLEDQDVDRRVHLYLAFFPFFWMTILIQRGIRMVEAGGISDWMANGLPGSVRLRRYLARSVAWPKMDFLDNLARWESLTFFPSAK